MKGLTRAIEARRELALTRATDLNMDELNRLRRDVLARSAEEPDWRRDYPKWRLVFYAFGYTTRFVTDRDFRKASMVFARKHFRPRRLRDRKVIEFPQESG